MSLIASVSMVLGPLLTLILFKPGKRGLKFDIWVICIIQIITLSWVTWVMYKERPYVVVFADYYFKPLTKHQLLNSVSSPGILQSISNCPTKPCLIYSNLPKDKDKLNSIRLKALQTSRPLYMLGEYYTSFSPASISGMKSANINLTEVLINNVLDRSISYTVHEKIITYQNYSDRLMFIPISSRYKESITVFNPQNYKIIDTIDHNLRTYK